MRVGSLVFATEQGLGHLAKDFYDNGVLTDVLVVRHGRRQEREDWYPNEDRWSNLSNVDFARNFCRTMDVILFFETPFEWSLIDYCRSQGIPTILMPMHECMPKVLPAIPDIMACPSDLDYDLYERKSVKGDLPGCEVVRVSVPVEQRWYQRDVAKVFVHNAGHGGLKGRNGTKELIQALQYIKSPAEVVIRSQDSIEWRHVDTGGCSKVDLVIGSQPRDQLYLRGDVFVFPESFNGLSLPLQEAAASGMLVMATNRYPNNTYLPREPLIPILNEVDDCISQRLETFDRAIISPKNIARCIDEWYGRDISDLSRAGREWAKTMSWEVHGPMWKQMLEGLVSRETSHEDFVCG